jgi:segregation and condensation protein A|tara:strand:- start:2943 stop:3596 length:654 start_codon:yes stop_codon:yes gene_type:complete
VVKEKSDLSKPPLNILINPTEMKTRKPWEIDLQELLEMFIKIIEQMETPDLRLCGSAALSSALIYRLKVESLFLFEKLKIKRRITDRLDPPQMLEIPYRYELSTTNLDDLVSTLESILDEMISQQIKKPKTSVIEVEPIIEVDIFSVQIQKALKELKRDIGNLLREKKRILFSEYVMNMNTLDRVRTFLLLLFIANDGLIRIIQDEEDMLIIGAIQK